MVGSLDGEWEEIGGNGREVRTFTRDLRWDGERWGGDVFCFGGF